jgi:hypothetical protein
MLSFRRFGFVAPIAFLVVLAACSGASETISPTTGGDASSPAPGASGSSVPPPASHPPDTGGADAGTTDATAPDASNCAYEADDQWIVDCAATPPGPKKVTVLKSPGCPDAFLLGGASYPSLDKALSAQSCNAACVRHAFQAVLLVRCGKKTEYTTYKAPSCTDVIDTPDGIYANADAWAAAHPCNN